MRNASDLATIGVTADSDQFVRRELGAEVTGQDPGLAPEVPDRLAVETELDGGHIAGDGELDRMDTDNQSQESGENCQHVGLNSLRVLCHPSGLDANFKAEAPVFIFPSISDKLATCRFRRPIPVTPRRIQGTARKDPLTTLTRIQMVVYLQAVDLFTYCNAEQMMRIAGIVRQESFAEGERIYAVNDPAEAMYCVVEGAVDLRSETGAERRVASRETFGAREILSDRLRGEEARAERPTTALAIDAEDLFDLLSNNVEIVKALFRQLLRHPETFEHLHESETSQLAAQ